MGWQAVYSLAAGFLREKQMSFPQNVVGRSILVVLLAFAPKLATSAEQSAVTVREDEASFTLSNGMIEARILKQSGDIRSLKYKGTELLTDRSGHPGGYWSHDTTGGKGLVTKVTIDPAENGGERAEVSVKGISGGVKMGHGPGTAADGDFPTDIEIRYSIGRGESGIYTYCVFDHLGEYDAGTIGEARFAVKLADFFDWMSIDKRRNKLYPRTIRGEDKYVYTALQSENRAYGFSSTTRNLGFFFINPSVEYLSGGPTKPEFLCHRDTTPVQAPVVLNYWRSSHYGGANVSVDDGEAWTRVVGPFLLYVNEGSDPAEMWHDAVAQAGIEADKWPYDWVEAKGFAKPQERSTVTGRLVLEDPQLAHFPGTITVGLAHPSYTVTGWRGRTRTINWQTDAKHYQFWARSNDQDGVFEIPNVSPGKYTLYAFADGVLGEFMLDDVVIAPGTNVDLGQLDWKPVRRGKQIWEVGIPNRTATEFAAGERYFEPDITLQYPKLFPDDVTYTIGESHFDKDWFFAQVPHNIDPDARVQPFRGVVGRGRATPYTIQFQMDDDPVGTGVLRLAICGTGARPIGVTVNGKPAGSIDLGFGDGVIARHQIQGRWYEREFEFDVSLLQ
jgi:rhamnogalacturonan endolyase